DVTVVGGGVAGLTAGRVLQERGWRVRILARERVARSTSAVPAAYFHPYHVGADRRVQRWAEASLARYLRLAADPASGVSLLPGVDVFRSRRPATDPWWSRLL